MDRFLLAHRHTPEECRFAYAAWRGFASPLRGRSALSSCPDGGHELWWIVDADGAGDALARLPSFLADRTTVTVLRDVPIP